MVRLKRI